VQDITQQLFDIQSLLIGGLKEKLESGEATIHDMRLASQILKDNNIYLPPKKGDPTLILEAVDAAIEEIEYKPTTDTDNDPVEAFTPIQI
jgi:hypothetical protein